VLDTRGLPDEPIQDALAQIKGQCLLPASILIFTNQDEQYPSQHTLDDINILSIKCLSQPLGKLLVEYQSHLNDAFIVFTPNLKWNRDHTFNLISLLAAYQQPVYSPTFTSYQTLLDAHETMEYAIKGLDGNLSKITSLSLQRFESTAYANGNILIPSACIKNDELQRQIRWFDVGCVWLILYHQWLAKDSLPILSYAITSFWQTNDSYGESELNQYELAGRKQKLFNDRNYFYIFYEARNAELNDLKSIWENQQKLDKVSNRTTGADTISSLATQLNRMDQCLNSGDFSKQLSVILYLRNILRNRPLLLKITNTIHHSFSKILKL
jgi:hypothetical protein